MRMILGMGTALAMLALLSGCGHGRAKPGALSDKQRLAMHTPVTMTAGAAWRGLAEDADRERLRRLRDAYDQGIASARASGQGATVDALGALADPNSGLAKPALPAGDYRCRTVKVGSQIPGGLGYVAYPAFPCRIEVTPEGVRFIRTGGSQRAEGTLYPDDGSRLIFLGSMALGDEQAAHSYGIDKERDMIGVVERIGPSRWRMALPFPQWESLLDLIEITPAG